MTDLTISDWKLLKLTLDQTGPFQDAVRTVNFTGVRSEDVTDPPPANLFMILAKNGHGKTTILESVHGLFGLLSNPPTGRFAERRSRERVQADLRATWTIGGKTQTVLLSIWTGIEVPLLDWTPAMLDEDAQASEWARIYVDSNGNIKEADALGQLLLDGIRSAQGSAPTAIFGESQELPTVLFFPADRRLVAPTGERSVTRPKNFGYAPAQLFGSDGPEWSTSIDNLLVWLEWLDDGRLDGLLKYVNEELFSGEDKALLPPRRADLQSVISSSSGEHPLSHLSHGERALLQLYVRVACHMTRNTIILIDEVETHLHSKWMHRAFQALKRLLVLHPQLSIVFSTHNRELLKAFDHQRLEAGLVKGGHLIEEGV
ncbi:ATP-binding protein [Phyllobacterium sp. 21LDTY02-6]|uniref:AAA family ATPase n=1 Tax=Phyllobacterium sp. 21LDTY02-6 TaxID=2944903 RepID=UPI0020204F03|nr:AAA family ATPase [Phyllobacterium sp. 21LDTY02-6]MCO4317809.1 ATP-binding protein [Phyllobacterium sp. 21LDTY02-6]